MTVSISYSNSPDDNQRWKLAPAVGRRVILEGDYEGAYYGPNRFGRLCFTNVRQYEGNPFSDPVTDHLCLTREKVRNSGVECHRFRIGRRCAIIGVVESYRDTWGRAKYGVWVDWRCPLPAAFPVGEWRDECRKLLHDPQTYVFGRLRE